MRHLLTRRALYDLVWARPLASIAPELGLSEVALRKLCLKHSVPTPPRGYWAKKAAGQKVRPVYFHEASDAPRAPIIIRGTQPPTTAQLRAAIARERQRRRQQATASAANTALMDGQATTAHPALVAMFAALRRTQPDPDGKVYLVGPTHTGIAVSVAQAARAMELLQGLARELTARGLILDAADGDLLVAAPPDVLRFSLTQRTDLPDSDDPVPAGALKLQLADEAVRGLRRSWGDGKRQRLEEMLGAVADGMVDYLAGMRARREDHEAWQRAWDRQQRRAALMQARQARETQRRGFVQHLASIASEADELRALLTRLRAQATPGANGDLSRLLHWLAQRVHVLEGKLSPARIGRSLRETRLFAAPGMPAEAVEDDAP